MLLHRVLVSCSTVWEYDIIFNSLIIMYEEEKKYCCIETPKIPERLSEIRRLAASTVTVGVSVWTVWSSSSVRVINLVETLDCLVFIIGSSYQFSFHRR